MSKFSVVILTKNEENNILDCLESTKDASEIIVVDDYSEDRTLEVVRNFKNKKIKIYQHSLDADFSMQRNFGLSKAKNEWVLFVDADERVSPELSNEIKSTVNGQLSDVSGFYIKRSDWMWGKELKHGETGNIQLLRLARKNAGKWKGSVHETWEVKGEIGSLANVLVHYPHPTVGEFLSEISLYSSLRAKELVKRGVKPSLFQIIFYPKGKFLVNYFLKLGFLDGTPGLVTAIMMSFHSFLVRSKVWQANQRQSTG